MALSELPQAGVDLSDLRAALQEHEARIIAAMPASPHQTPRSTTPVDLEAERSFWMEGLKVMIQQHLADQTAAIKQAYEKIGQANEKIEVLKGPVVEIQQTQRLQTELQQTQQLQMQQLHSSVIEIRQAAMPMTNGAFKQEKHLQAALHEPAPAPLNDASRAKLPEADALTCSMRSAMRTELGDLLAVGGRMRDAVRSEVDAALSNHDSWRISRNNSRYSLSPTPRSVGVDTTEGIPGSPVGSPPVRMQSAKSEKSAPNQRASHVAAVDHFASFVEAVQDNHAIEHYDSEHSESLPFANLSVVHSARNLWMWLMRLEEPPRVGCFAHFVDSRAFDLFVCATILFNLLVLIITTNMEVQNSTEDRDMFEIMHWSFQAFYTWEVMMKLAVHRLWFFWNKQWSINLFDFLLVVVGFGTLATSGRAGEGFWRTLRLFKFAKSLRAFRVMKHLQHLRALMICLLGSCASLFWSLVMLCIVYLLFSLFLVQLVSNHLQVTGELLEESRFLGWFGSVEESMLTLYKASTGGDDWSYAYHVIEPTGPLGCAVYLMFIAFVQFALINIITGIFVESAMMTLSPDSDTLAQEHSRRERENSHKLIQLCRNVDADFSGKLTREQFEDGLRRKQIPLLLNLLGLQKHHVLEFFSVMAEAANDEGQVGIETFVNGCMLLKGNATNFDLQKLHAEVRDTKTRHQQSLDDILELLRGYRLEEE